MPHLPHPRTALSGYADRRLPRWRRAVVRRHLRRCTRCAVEVGRIRALGEMLRAAPPVPGPSDALVDRLLAIGGVVPSPALDQDAQNRAGASAQPGLDGHHRAGVGAAGVLVAAVLMVGTVGAGAVVTGVPVPWPSASARASVSTVLPRLWPAPPPADDPASDRPVDTRPRP